MCKCICHIPDLNDLIKGIDKLLSKSFIFEEPYLGSMINNVSYDQIYDNILYFCYFTKKVLLMV